MAEVSRGRGILGRFLTSLGFIWLLWALFGELVALELGFARFDLPLLPGFLILFLGRALSRGAGRPRAPEQEGPSQPQTRRPAPRPIEPRPSMPQPRPVDPSPPQPRAQEPEPIATEEFLAIGGVVDEASEAELTRLAEEIGERKTSAEMVAEARERFGKRPG